MVPQVENIINGLLWHRCWYIRSIAQCPEIVSVMYNSVTSDLPENIDKVLGIFVNKEDSIFVKLLFSLPLNYIRQPETRNGMRTM